MQIAESSLTLLTELEEQVEINKKLISCGNIGGIQIFYPDPMTKDNPRYTDEDNIIFYGTNSEILAFYE